MLTILYLPNAHSGKIGDKCGRKNFAFKTFTCLNISRSTRLLRDGICITRMPISCVVKVIKIASLFENYNITMTEKIRMIDMYNVVSKMIKLLVFSVADVTPPFSLD